MYKVAMVENAQAGGIACLMALREGAFEELEVSHGAETMQVRRDLYDSRIGEQVELHNRI